VVQRPIARALLRCVLAVFRQLGRHPSFTCNRSFCVISVDAGHGAEGFMAGMEKQPRRIEAFDDIGSVVQLACGSKHMLAIVEESE